MAVEAQQLVIRRAAIESSDEDVAAGRIGRDALGEAHGVGQGGEELRLAAVPRGGLQWKENEASKQEEGSATKRGNGRGHGSVSSPEDTASLSFFLLRCQRFSKPSIKSISSGLV